MPQTIEALYAASKAGVEIDLIIRGMCALRPGVPGLSERIRVRSIVGRFLEHTRIFWFANGGANEIFAGSADWMPRNLFERCEVVFPITDPALVQRLRDEILGAYLRDNRKARLLQPDGAYIRVAASQAAASAHRNGSWRRLANQPCHCSAPAAPRTQRTHHRQRQLTTDKK